VVAIWIVCFLGLIEQLISPSRSQLVVYLEFAKVPLLYLKQGRGLIPDTITEIKITLEMQSDLKKRQQIESLLGRIEDLQIPAGGRHI
jgi:hypothetical protein